MGLGEHLDELRRRVMWGVLGLIPILIVALVYADGLLAIMLQPVLRALRDAGLPPMLQATGVLETFMTWFKVAMIATLVVGAPWVLFQAWKFVAPGLYASERRFAYILTPLSITLTAAGVVFMYFVMLPAGLFFLVNFGNDLGAQQVEAAPLPAGVVLTAWPVLKADPDAPQPGQVWINESLKEIRVCISVTKSAEGKTIADVRGTTLTKQTTVAQQYRIREYVDLFFGLTLAFVVAFQLPVVVLLLGWVGLVTPKGLGKYRKHAFMICAVAGAILTPTPDPLSMMLLQVPMYLLFELGVLLLRLLPASRVRGKGPRRGDPQPEQHDAGGP